nr:immunoglobulin light chain junction region [Mus musculus]NSL98008.1 immunoglobulin light chain junction region [Mus musculus]NSL98188.1 immunoglobulin light chain junction region [Mus musculus]NSL98327.1 immunoglobulin light chain junction region [Mus musculus]NSL98650.1 immunoglobulin light chain junction region [Mus musculus]
CQHSRELPYTF